MFDFFKNRNKDKSEVEVKTDKPTINLSKLDLRKKEVSSICLEKKELNNLTSRVALVLDFSGSMGELYRNGTVQDVVERIFPLALQFDDNGELDLWIFENGFKRLDSVNMSNIYGYIDKIYKKYNMGGTCYAPVMKDVTKKYLKEESSKLPNYVIFITDGDNSDRTKTEELIKDISSEPIFWQFVGIGYESFDTLERLDKMNGRVVDNANFFEIEDINSISDKELYNKLLNEYPNWLKVAREKNILK